MRRRAVGRGGSAGGGLEFVMADSGTRRREEGSIRLDCVLGPDWVVELSRLGRPRAAAAQDRRVDRLARSAASWSAVCDGAIMLYGLWFVLERLG